METILTQQWNGSASSATYDADGNLLTSTSYADGSTSYTAEYQYDWRNRQTDALSPADVVTHYDYDNLGRTLWSKTYASDNFTLSSSELRAETANLYDSLGRAYESRTYEVDQQDAANPGTLGDYLPSKYWYDAAGRLVKTANGNGLFQKYAYDGLGRVVETYLCYDADETAYADADDVTGDTVVQQSHTWYDRASQVVATASYERLPDDTSTVGALNAANSYAVASVVWYDGLGRTIVTVNYGREDVNSGLTHYIFHATSGSDAGGNYSAGDLVDVGRNGIPDVAEAAPPATNSSDNYIVALTQYDSAGRAYRATDNLGRIGETQYDDAGRVLKTIQNYANGTVAETDTTQDVTVAYEYDSGGRMVTMTAYNAKGSGNGIQEQATKYLYTSVVNAGWQTAVVYPDSTDVLSQDGTTKIWTITTNNGDHVSTSYDRLGRTTSTTEQRGVVHDYTFDSAGRLSADTATSLGSSGIVDGSIRRIGTAYDDIGRVRTVTSYSDTAGNTAVNQVKYEYNAWSQVYREYEEHDGLKDGSTLFVQYGYADGASGGVAKYVRLDQVTYPNGRAVHYDYGTTGAIDDIMSRLATIGDGTNTQAGYKYLGAGRIVVEDYEDIDVKLDYTANNLAALDRFGRVADQVWTDYGENPDVVLDEYTYTYDRAGNRTGRDNELHSAFDEDYTYDALDRLTAWSLGGTQQKTWSLDSLGNNLSAGTYNAANEETPSQGSSGYDAAGNMTTLQSGKTAKYDAWNRLVEVDDGATVVAKNEYDGTNRRIQIFSNYSGGTPGKSVDDYQSGQQTIESDITVDGNRAGGYQYLWSSRYIDSLILRDTLNTAGTAIVQSERVFYLADANYNVTGLVKYDSGSGDWEVAERYTYTPYGVVTYRNTDWTTAGSSTNANTTLYTGRTLDLLTSLYYYRARYYDAGLERFVNRDPADYMADENLYRYVGNRPLTYVDPSGLWGGGSGGHGDMPGSDEFDWDKEDRDYDPFKPRYTWRHFRTLRESEVDLVNAVRNCDKAALETYGHQMQDWFSHRGQGYKGWSWQASAFGFVFFGPIGILGGWGHGVGNILGWIGLDDRPDNIDDYADAFREAKTRTQYWLGRWNSCCQKDSSGNWTKKCDRNENDCDAPVDYSDYDWADNAPPASHQSSSL